MIIKDQLKQKDLLNLHEELYIKDLQVKIQRYSNYDNWTITKLDNALQPGKKCAAYTLKAVDFDAHNVSDLVYYSTFTTLLKMLDKLPFKQLKDYEDSFEPIKVDGIEYFKRLEKSNKVYTPFYKPGQLNKIPDKWTLTHVRKAILNGQFKDLRKKYRYTDDYAYDAACNYGEGPIDGTAFIKDIIESPSGWWCSYDKNNNIVTVACHSFDSNCFTPVL